MESQQSLTLRLTAEDNVKLRTTVGGDTHELTLDRGEFERLYQRMLRLRAKLDLHDARSAIVGPRAGRRD